MIVSTLAQTVSDYLWSWPLVGLLVGAGLYFTLLTHAVQFRMWAMSWRLLYHQLFARDSSSGLSACLSILSASLGNGALAGMATALASGGPGALVWLWVFGLLGLVIRFVESYVTLTQTCADNQGAFQAGPLAYLRLVPGSSWVVPLYALFCLVTSFVAGCAMQCNSMVLGLGRIASVNSGWWAFGLTALLLVVLRGGDRRILRVSTYLGPIKVILFFISVGSVIVYHYDALLPSIYEAFRAAFAGIYSSKAAWGGLQGITVLQSIRYSFARAASASEVGLGTAGVFMATTQRQTPFAAAVMSMATMSISIFVVCSGMMLAILTSGVLSTGLTSTALSSAAVETLFGAGGAYIITFLAITFGLGVMIGYAFVGLQGWRALVGAQADPLFYLLYVGMIWWGCLWPARTIWAAVDLANAGMLLLNMYGIIWLFTRHYKSILCFDQDQVSVDGPYRVACHTDHVGLGSVFIAIPGTRQDGNQFIPQACHKGARVVVYQEGCVLPDATQLSATSDVQYVATTHARQALSLWSARAYDYPARQLTIIGVTGTKGKSTTTFLIEHILRSCRKKVARLSTVSNSINGKEFPASLTTPQPDYIHHFFAACLAQEVEYVVMELAAQAETMHRLDHVPLARAMFMNFSQEHGEFYPSQDDYFAAKAAIMQRVQPGGVAWYCGDDERIAACAQDAPASACLVYGRDVGLMESDHHGVTVDIDGHRYHVPHLMGSYNALNVLYAVRCAQSLGLSNEAISHALACFSGVPGRLNRYGLPGDRSAFIDYAHNPQSIEAVLQTLRPMTSELIVVMGAGGDRDRVKRPAMGTTCARYADKVWFTSDNPRSEDPQAIVHDLCAGLTPDQQGRVIVELDREQAIRKAYQHSAPGAYLVLLGKGPDEYQIIKGTKHPFSERAILQQLHTL